jgi:lantibiotic transport system ATP-binding protein
LPDFALQLEAVTYRYPGSTHGVENVRLTAPAESVYGLVGANGAGKTTIMRLMTGLLEPDTGNVLCLGATVRQNRVRLLRSVGSLIEIPSLYHHLTGIEHLRVFAAYTGTPRSAIDRALSLSGLTDAGSRRIREYSLGMKQRLGLATALLHDPRILILDEPTNGLDPMGIADMRRLMTDLARSHGKTVIVSSHLLGEVEKIAARIGVLDQGRMQFEGSVSELAVATRGVSRLHLQVSSAAHACEVLGTSALMSNGIVTIPCADQQAAAAIVRRLTSAGIDVYDARRDEPSLERDFLSLVRGSQ